MRKVVTNACTCLTALGGFFVLACTGQITGQPGSGSGGDRTNPTDPGADPLPGFPAGTNDMDPSIDPQTPMPPRVPAGPSVAPAPLVRLSAVELRNTLVDLFGEAAVGDFPFQLREGPPVVDQISSIDAVQAFTLAENVAERVHKTGKVMLCTPGQMAAADCLERIARTLGKLIFRRPLDDREIARYVQGAGAAPSFDEGVRNMVAALLASPNFLYRIARGDANRETGSARPLEGFEIAARLSYALWQSMPDGELFAAAEQGDLANIESLQAQARRMLQGPRARAVVGAFHAHWLKLDRVASVTRDPTVYPGFTSEMPKQWTDETRTFVDQVIFDGPATLREIFTAPYTFAQPNLARLYGASADSGGRVVLPEGRRAGVLTQAALLGPPANSERTAPIHRGAFIYRSLLCATLPDPPADVPPIPPSAGDTSLREQIEVATGAGSCGGCHNQFNGLGFALGNFDGIGSWTEVDTNDKPVDAAVSLAGPEDLEGVDVDGPVALGKALAGSAALRDCYVDKWFEFMSGRGFDPDNGDAYSRLLAQYEFEIRSRDVRELLVSLVGSDAFRYVRVPGP